MKKTLAWLMATVLVLSLAACGGKPEQTPAPSPSEEPSQSQPAEDRTAIAQAELIGTWEMVSWDLLDGGSETSLSGNYLVFTDDVMDYVVSGIVKTHNSYSIEDAYTLKLKDLNSDAVADWTMYLNNAKGALVFEDTANGICYNCVRYEGELQIADAHTAEKAGDVSADGLLGKWEILGWVVDSDGSWAPLGSAQYYVFESGGMTYDAGAGQEYPSAYTYENGMLKITDWSAPMEGGCWSNEEGLLCIADGRYGITYVCKLIEKIAPETAPEGTEASKETQAPADTEKPEPTKAPEESKQPEPSATPEPTQQPEPSATPEPAKEPEAKQTNAEMMIGKWKLIAWDLTTGGYRSETPNDFFIFGEKDIQYTSNGSLVNESTYQWTDDSSFHGIRKDDNSIQFDWKLEIQDDGTITLTDAANYLIYYCQKAE